ncbi:MAG: hypothetical protein NTZ50_10680 [Chloroflexi bacterium]|nr:hypothetical protein [Chloroflexota bacterium]
MQKILHAILCVAVVFAVTACNVEFAPAPADSNASAVTDVPSAGATKAPKKQPTQISSTDAAKAPKKKPTQTSSTDATQSDAPVADGAIDSGFRPDPNGFAFENYGNEDGVTNLTVADIQRLFGDQPCARMKKGVCVLTPAGRAWMREINKSMDGGHCEGFAVLSSLMYMGKIAPQTFGAEMTDQLTLEDNTKLQREIAYWYSTQYTSKGTERFDMTPVQVVNELAAQFARESAGEKKFESYVIGIYKPGYEDGHALTPFAVRENDDGSTEILIYDNNYPMVERSILVDRKKNTWQYQASTNPNEEESLYRGTAKTKTLTIAPISARLKKQHCPFCKNSKSNGSGGVKLGAPATEYNEIILDGHVGMLITDEQGRRLGVVDGELLNEIPDAQFVPVRSAGLWADDHEPVYRIPRGVAFTATLDAANLVTGEMASLTLIGPGYTLAVDGIELEKNQVDVIRFAADGSSLTYKTYTDLTPLLTVGVESDVADYEFEVIAEGDANGQEVTLRVDPSAAILAITTAGHDKTSTYDLTMTRYSDLDDETFEETGIELAAGATDYVQYGKWTGQGKPLRIAFDLDDDGVMDGTLDVQDAK